MKGKILYKEMSIGYLGKFILLIFCFFIFSLSAYLFWIPLPLLLIPLALIFAMDEVHIDFDNNRYQSGTSYFGFVSFSKWTELNPNCVLKINPKSKVTSFDTGRVNHGSISRLEAGLLFIDPILKNTLYLGQGSYSSIEHRANNYARRCGIRVVDFKDFK